MSDLVERLSTGMHPVEVSLRPERTVRAFKDAIDRGYVHVKFTGTRGGTELGVPVDASTIDLGEADFDAETGRIKLWGDLRLDYVDVRCVAEIELPSMQGQGRLEILPEQRSATA